MSMDVIQYDKFYGLASVPFALTPAPTHGQDYYYHNSSAHRPAVSYIGYGMAQGEGCVIITGERGVGKSLLAALMQREVGGDDRLAIVKLSIPAPQGSTAQDSDAIIPRLFAEQCGLECAADDSIEAVLKKLKDYADEVAQSEKHLLLIIDNSEHLSEGALAMLGEILDFQLGGKYLVQGFLFGRPELQARIADSPLLAEFRGHVLATHRLGAMGSADIEPYISHALEAVGGRGKPEFSSDCYPLLYRYSGGIPRHVNYIVDRLLNYGAAHERTHYIAEHIESIVADIPTDMSEFATMLEATIAGEDIVQTSTEPSTTTALSTSSTTEPTSPPYLAETNTAGNVIDKIIQYSPFYSTAQNHNTASGAANLLPNDDQAQTGISHYVSMLESQMIEQEKLLREMLSIVTNLTKETPALTCHNVPIKRAA